MVPVANNMISQCPEAFGSTRFPRGVKQSPSFAAAAMATMIPDSDDQYYYSDIDDVHALKDPSVRQSEARSWREDWVQPLREALSVAKGLILINLRDDLPTELPPFSSESDSESDSDGKSWEGIQSDCDG